ncbi:MAG: hypothetical protein K2X47_00680, partial [Bdellovibrionales bacterium]|nr:hypothetical protein [Bdellovibrionales bacterium]
HLTSQTLERAVKINLTKISLLISGALLIGLFQNCGQNMLFQSGSLSQKAALVPIDTSEGNLGNPDITDPQNPGQPVAGDKGKDEGDEDENENEGSIPPTNPTYPGVPTNPTNPSAPTYPSNPSNPMNPSNPTNPSNPNHPATVQGATSYVCILQGPGRSVRAGIAGNQLESQTSVPQSVCMSQKACLQMVSLKLPVKEAFLSGPCLNNPHAIHLNDAEVADLVGIP